LYAPSHAILILNMQKILKKIIFTFIVIIIVYSAGNIFLKAASIPFDPLWDDWNEYAPAGNNWGQEFIKLPSAWEITTGWSIYPIGVVDNGFDINHNDLKDIINITLSDKFDSFKTNTTKDNHGTHISGVIGAVANNEIGVTGVEWSTELRVYNQNFLATNQNGDHERVSTFLSTIAMTNSAINKGAKIINLSQGICSSPSNLCNQNVRIVDLDTFDHFIGLINKVAKQKGYDILFVFSAGNNKDNLNTASPARMSKKLDNVISVAAIDESGNLADEETWGSNYGNVTVAAPGVDIFSTLPNNRYGNMSGTSMSAPFVSGLAGLIYSRAEELGKTLTASEVKQLIIDGAVKGGKFAEGPDGIKIPIINAYESLKLLEPQYCGNGIIDDTEECDGTELGGATCESVLGATYAGSLACALDCIYDTSECYELSPVSKAPWSTLGYDGTRSGQSIYNGPTTNAIKWTYTATSAWGSPYFGIVPVVGQDGTTYIGNETEGKLYAFNTNGTVKWIFSNNGSPLGAQLSAPTISDGGTIYIGSSTGILFAINPDGTEKWRYKLDTGHWVGTSVVDENGNIYFTSTYPSVDNKLNYLYAINSDGIEKWKYQIENFSGIAHTAIGPDGTIYSSSIYTYSYNDLLYAVLPNGKLKWKKFYRPGTSPVVGPDGTIYFKNVYLGLEAVNPDDGSLKWYKNYLSIFKTFSCERWHDYC
ncbi:S8 family serine peptidase, partial [Patescibacteria group bacterium]|nr:S8 family serine peptidase [Patescibacteria group bacterium]